MFGMNFGIFGKRKDYPIGIKNKKGSNKMNEAQKIVLFELKAKTDVSNPFSCVKRVKEGDLDAYGELSKRQEFEVLAEFAKWGLKNE